MPRLVFVAVFCGYRAAALHCLFRHDGSLLGGSMDLDIPALLNNGGIIALLSAFLAYFINAYKNEVNDHKDTLKEMAMVRQKQEEVKTVVDTWKSRKEIETASGI